MSRIKVAEIVEATTGGIWEHLRQILTFVDRDRFAVTVICSVRRDHNVELRLEDFCAGGIPVVRVPMSRAIRPWNDLRCCRRIAWELRVQHFDVVHTHGSKGGIIGRFAAHRAGGARVIHTGHTFPIQWAQGLEKSFYATLERRAARWTDRILALSDAQRRMLLDERICPADKITVLPNAIDVEAVAGPERRSSARERLGLPTDAPTVGMVGRIVEQKDPMLFVRTAQIIHQAMPDARFVWIGDGPLREKMEAAARDAGLLGTSLMIAGRREDARELYAAFDVFLMNTAWEGMPYVVLEAMAASVPVVAVNVPGMNEIVEDGATGKLSEADARALAGEVLGLLANADLRATYGEAGRRRVADNYSVHSFIEKLEALYATVDKSSGSEDTR